MFGRLCPSMLSQRIKVHSETNLTNHGTFYISQTLEN
jgi:hypothetical protein